MITNNPPVKNFKYYAGKHDDIGTVDEVIHTIVYVSEIPHATIDEVVMFETGEIGQVSAIHQDLIEVLLFSDKPMDVGTKVARTKEKLKVPVGKELLGHTINALCIPISDQPLTKPKEEREIDIPPSSIDNRKRITKPLQTGVTMVDMLIPLAQGQRELIIGDRKIGKTNFLLRTVLAQAKTGVICIYAAIGKKQRDIKQLEEFFEQHNIRKNVVIIAATAEDPPSMISILPFTAMTIGEYFRDQEMDSLIVFDDLTTHAKYARQIALLAKRFPGRDSYPTDIFYTHARILERAGNFITKHGTISITALIAAESNKGDITGYIQTNLMSITDGHIFFDADLYTRGKRPAINPFLSVSRVGHQTQTLLKQDITRELTAFLTLYEKMQSFIHFGAEITDNVKTTLATGDKINAYLNQDKIMTIPSNLQVFLFALLWVNQNNEESPLAMKEEMNKIILAYFTNPSLQKSIDSIVKKTKTLNDLLRIIKKDGLELTDKDL